MLMPNTIQKHSPQRLTPIYAFTSPSLSSQTHQLLLEFGHARHLVLRRLQRRLRRTQSLAQRRLLLRGRVEHQAALARGELGGRNRLDELRNVLFWGTGGWADGRVENEKE